MHETLEQALHDDAVALAQRVLTIACQRDLTFATAESCTGGLLAALLTDIPNCSHAFERGFVVYSAEAKAELLSIEPERIERYGVVSKEIAIDMALGALKASRADIAVSITGFAGPGEPGDEEGLVHLACARRNAVTEHSEEHFGAVGRADIRRATIDVALRMLERAVEL
jgi:nicotinamide-nucleotide amidase